VVLLLRGGKEKGRGKEKRREEGRKKEGK